MKNFAHVNARSIEEAVAVPREGPYRVGIYPAAVLRRKYFRTCAESAGQDVYNIAHRGFASKVVFDFDFASTLSTCHFDGGIQLAL